MTDNDNDNGRPKEEGEHEDTVSNTALYARKKPRTPAEFAEEFAKTGNPLAWCLMKLMEPKFQFAPDYVGPEGDPADRLKEPKAYGLQDYEQDRLRLDTGEKVTSWYKKAQEGFPTVVYCHGNASSLDARAAYLKEIADRGFGVIIAAYPGFKGHEKNHDVSLCSEAACNATGRSMVKHLMVSKKIDPKKIVLFGESLGGAVALRTSYDMQHGIPQINGPRGNNPPPNDMPVPFVTHGPTYLEATEALPVICCNTFSSLVKRAKEQFPMLPADMLMDNRFESDKIIGDIDAPMLLIHGKDDEYTRPAHSRLLKDASNGKAELQLLDGVNHSATDLKTERRDMKQVQRVVDCAHQFMFEKHLCPTAPSPPTLEHDDAQWSAGDELKSPRGRGARPGDDPTISRV